MRNYSSEMDQRMFDFKVYYETVAAAMPDNCRVVECGLADGASAIYLAEAILNLGKRIERFVMVDSLDYGGAKQRHTIMSHIIKSGLGSIVEFWDMSSLDASCQFNDGYLHHVFLDSSHLYQQTKAEIRCWYPKLLHNYFLSGHDYTAHAEVKQAVDELIPAEKLQVFLTAQRFDVWGIKKNDNFKIC
jgi:cephalosporin hydroxylase